MATILNRDFTTEYLDLPSKPSMVVAEHFEDKVRLCDIAQNLGYAPYGTEVQWPRDRLVTFNGLSISEDKLRGFGEGGMTSYNDSDFFISYVVLHIGYSQHKIRMMERALGSRIHLVPSPNESNHIDLTMLALKEGILVDKDYHDEHAHYFSGITNVYPIQFSPEEKKYYPLNCLVLNDVVIANKHTPTLHGALKELGINYETVSADISYNHGGSIRCRTNVADHPNLLRKAGIHLRTRPIKWQNLPDISACTPDRNSSA